MWQRTLDTNLVPDNLKPIIGSIWECIIGGKVLGVAGTLRTSALSDAYLWLEPKADITLAQKRMLPQLCDTLLRGLGEKRYFAETDLGDRRCQHFLYFCGFRDYAVVEDRAVFVWER